MAVIVGALIVDVLLSACGGVPAPSPPTPPPPVQRTVTISAGGVTPATITGPRATVEFVNQDSQVHDIRSDPHPGHTQCLELNLGAIAPGQRVAILSPFDPGRRCGYHDETRPDDPRFQGSIAID
jgi:hypothetical protein